MAKTEYNYDRIARLIRAYHTGELDIESRAVLHAWLDASADNQKLFDEITSPEQLSQEIKEMNSFDAQSKLEDFKRSHLEKSSPIRFSSWYKIGIAAAVALITIGVWMYFSPSDPTFNPESKTVHLNDVAPGKNTATLTLESGEVINLDTNKTSVVVTDSVKAMVMLTATTPRGGTYQITLPDGTKVWLNSDTKITFPSHFTGVERKVTLQGEAYFSVVHDPSKPFKVTSGQQEVTVLGTEFNVNAYGDDDKIMTTLLKGSVQVDATQQVILLPGQQSNLTNGQISVQKVDIESVVGWKNGVFLFYNTDLKSIMRQLSRWYDVEIDLSNMPENRFYGEISRDVRLSEVLTMLEATGNIKFKIEERRVMLQK